MHTVDDGDDEISSGYRQDTPGGADASSAMGTTIEHDATDPTAPLPALPLPASSVQMPDPTIYEVPTHPIVGAAITRPLVADDSFEQTQAVPLSGLGDRDRRTWWHRPRQRLIVIACIALALLIVSGGIVDALMFGSNAHTTNGSGPGDSATATPIAGPRMIQLALDKDALSSVFAQQLDTQQSALTDLQVVPGPGDSLMFTLNLHIDINDFHRVLPVELDGTIGLDQQQNLQLSIQHVKRDGIDAGPAAATSMQTALNQMLSSAIMPALRSQLQGARIVSVHTSAAIACDRGVEMFVLLIQAPPIQGIAAQPTPVPFCLRGQVDLKKLLP